MIAQEAIAGVILAGGLSRRMGGADKSLIELGGVPLVAHARNRLAPQVARLVISANGELSRFAPFCVPAIADTVPGHAGPLAGILAGMAWARENVPAATHVLSVAADTPFFPADLAQRLGGAIDGSDTIALAASGGRVHPVFALWPLSLGERLESFLEAGHRKVRHFVESQSFKVVDFQPFLAAETVVDPFFNINTPQDLAFAQECNLLIW